MIIMALVFAIILKKPANDEDEVAKEIIGTETPVALHEETKLRRKADPPPVRKLLEVERAQRKNVQRTQLFIREALFYSSFLVLLFLTIITMLDSRNFLQSSGVRNLLELQKKSFLKVFLIL